MKADQIADQLDVTVERVYKIRNSTKLLYEDIREQIEEL